MNFGLYQFHALRFDQRVYRWQTFQMLSAAQGSSPLNKWLQELSWTRMQGSEIPRGKGGYRIPLLLIHFIAVLASLC